MIRYVAQVNRNGIERERSRYLESDTRKQAVDERPAEFLGIEIPSGAEKLNISKFLRVRP
jgi:hypothetical protein